jgi:cell division transport system permease protein
MNMNWVTLKRILRAGAVSFWRNGFVSFASVLMMVFTLFIIGLAIFTGVILSTTLQQFRDKADMAVYFTTDASPDAISALQAQVNALPEVASTQFTSADDALAAFRELHQNDQLTLQALDELGGNPLGAELAIKAKDISQYGAIADFLKGQEALGTGQSQIIDKINYFDQQHYDAINRLAAVTNSAGWIGFILIAIFVITTVAISFNTLRLAIYTSREEISVMRLVGAGQTYIRAPFMVEGVLYGLAAGLITMLLFYPLTWWMGHATAEFFGGINVFAYYISHFAALFLVIVGAGVLLGALSSWLATRRYLKI